MKRITFFLFVILVIVVIFVNYIDKQKGKKLNNEINYIIFNRYINKELYVSKDGKKTYFPIFKESIDLPTIYSYDERCGYILFKQDEAHKPINLTKVSTFWIGSKDGYKNVKPVCGEIAVTIFNGYIYYISSIDKDICIRKVSIKTNVDEFFVNINNSNSITNITKLIVLENYILIKGNSCIDTQNKLYDGYIYNKEGRFLSKLSDIGDIVINDSGDIAWLEPNNANVPFKLKVYFCKINNKKIQSCNVFSPKIDFQFDYNIPRINITQSKKIAVWFYAIPKNDIKIVLVDIRDKLTPQQLELSFNIGEDRVFIF